MMIISDQQSLAPQLRLIFSSCSFVEPWPLFASGLILFFFASVACMFAVASSLMGIYPFLSRLITCGKNSPKLVIG